MRSALLWLPLVVVCKEPKEEKCGPCAGAAAVDRWFRFYKNIADNEGKDPKLYAPAGWTVTRPADVPRPWAEIETASKAKSVYRATVRGRSVIVKGRKIRSDGWSGDAKRDSAGGLLYLELVFLEALRGRRGIPELLGAWYDGPHVTYVVEDGGAPLGVGPSGVGREPNIMTPAFAARARAQPLKLAKALLECFGSWAAAGFFQDDLKAQQFTMNENGTVFMVDGPRTLADGPLGRAIERAWGKKARGAFEYQDHRGSCARDVDCPFTKESHSCRGAGTCEPGARGAPEARGKCRANACVPLSEKTHVYDVANRPWLLPYVAAKAADRAAGEFLRGLVRLAGRGRPEDRPSFTELVDRIDRYVEKPAPFAPGPKARLYASAVIRSNARRRTAFWDYASVSFTDLGHAGGVMVDGALRGLCAARGLACWESQVDGHGKSVPVPAHEGASKFPDRTKKSWGPLSPRDREDSGALDVLDGEFPFDVQRVRRALPPKVFAFTVVEDAWRVVRSLYYDRAADSPSADNIDAFVNASFPRGVQRHALRLAGIQPKDNIAITRAQCDRALQNLDAFDLIVDAASLGSDGLANLTSLLYGMYDVDAPKVAAAKPVGDLAASPAAKACVLKQSWCHAEVYAAARKKPAFFGP